MNPSPSDYRETLQRSQRVSWQLDDVLSQEARFDFDRPFLPEAMVGAQALPFLEPDEALALNHVRAAGYLGTFGLVEEFIVPFVLDHLWDRAGGSLDEVRALLSFVDEELKHIALFRRFERVFARGFGQRCELPAPPDEVVQHVRAHPFLAVGMLVLHIEWITQFHYVAMVKDDAGIETSFRRLLHSHWLEESQHARIDGWIVQAVAAEASHKRRQQAFEAYVALLSWLDQALAAQVDLDLQVLERTGLVLDEGQRERFRVEQHRAQQRTYLGAGVTHARVRAVIEHIHPPATAVLQELSHRWA